jgi:hypothetical protein
MIDLVDYVATKFSVNKSGVIIQYTDVSELPKSSYGDKSGSSHFQNSGTSRINKQKRSIANATSYLQYNCKYKPFVFTLTAPISCDYTLQNRIVSKFFNNLRKPHKWRQGKFKIDRETGEYYFKETHTITARCENYLWVREYQENGRPHWHCIADLPYIPIFDLQNLWLNLWNLKENYRNEFPAVRMNSKQNRFIKSDKFPHYLVKYFNKNFNRKKAGIHYEYKDKEQSAPRKFAISQQLQQLSKPITLNLVEHSNYLNRLLTEKKKINVGNGVFYYVPITKNYSSSAN